LSAIEANSVDDPQEAASLEQKLQLQERLQENVQDRAGIVIDEQLSDDPDNSESQALKEILESISDIDRSKTLQRRELT
jgi:ppGpp synthetase/RelA/SpoT-type nucleotidyltranferase